MGHDGPEELLEMWYSLSLWSGDQRHQVLVR
jgi:hypothetical protein